MKQALAEEEEDDVADIPYHFPHTVNANNHNNNNKSVKSPYYLYDGYAHLASGLACGLSGLASGVAIGVVGDAGVRANAQQPKLFVGMVLILIFAEALALYGLIVAILLTTNVGKSRA